MQSNDTYTILSFARLDGNVQELVEWLTEESPNPPVEMQTPGSAATWIELYLDTVANAEVLRDAVLANFDVDSVDIRQAPTQDWTTFWRHHFKPQAFGDRLYTLPYWYLDEGTVPEDAAEREVIIINPGLSFGTGDHFTTRFCLEALDNMITEGVRPDRVFDAGCGSAILSIGARKLGWNNIFAVDNDPRAIEQARENLERNEVRTGVELAVMDLTTQWPEGEYDVVFANLYGGLLMQFAEKLVRTCSGKLVLSGIRSIEAEAISCLFTDLGARELYSHADHEWAGFVYHCD